ncbi:MAG: energy-coupling factor transporter transmembrane protein EcfT [Lachnospiraceae bacterium]|nr:energy-coupling factor transporter transmembrane protein EcfT [Lachnospiraceae bacterium]MCR4685422.1 energy-coupling factor transporter transmembrane protein EcfT [Lachnospiraceae bacterium]
MNTKLFDYVERHNFIYDLSGVTKFLCFMIAGAAVMFTYDIRVMVVVFVVSIIAFLLSQITFKQIRLMVIYVAIFIAMNVILTFLFSPQYGVEIYGTKHVIFELTERYTLTWEQVMYQGSKVMKYLAIIPLGMIFILATHPSEMASSMNRIGIPYKATYALALTLRYFPDVIRDYQDISVAQQARGLDMSHKEKFTKRLKNILNICIPLIFTTLDRIELISNAMDLRSFGMHKKRTWYCAKKLNAKDYLALFICIALLALSIYMIIFVNHSRFYNPFT